MAFHLTDGAIHDAEGFSVEDRMGYLGSGDTQMAASSKGSS